jgi:S1-C subfamily serine protease
VVTAAVASGSRPSDTAGGFEPASRFEVDAFLFAAMDRLERQIAAAVAQARESVVALEYTAADAPVGTRRIATGVVVNQRGEVLSVKIDSFGDGNLPTQAGKNSTPILARDHSGRSHIAQWVAADPETGLTLLQITPRALRPIRVAADGPNLCGQVFVLGNPFGMGQSVSRGHIAGLNSAMELADRQLAGMIQIQAPLYPGDSGAALVDVRGELLGLVRSGLAVPGFRGVPRSGADRRADVPIPSIGGQSPSGARADTSPDPLDQAERDNDFGFAIPARDALWVADQLHACGRVDRAYLGVRLEGVPEDLVATASNPPAPNEKQNASARSGVTSVAADVSSSKRRTESHNRGVLVEVLAGTPAAEAGLRTGDRIVSVDGRPIRSAHDLIDRLDRILARTTIQLGVIRAHGSRREKILLSLRTASRPSRNQVTQVESTTSGLPPASPGSSTPSAVVPVTAAPPVPASAPVPTSASAAPAASMDFTGAAAKPAARSKASPSQTAPLGEQPAQALASGLRQSDLQLTLPRAVVERLEQLERRLKKLESPSEGVKSLSAKQAPQIGSVRNP